MPVPLIMMIAEDNDGRKLGSTYIYIVNERTGGWMAGGHKNQVTACTAE